MQNQERIPFSPPEKSTVQITIEAEDGNRFTFSYGDFAKSIALDEMLKIKNGFSEQNITVNGVGLIDKAIRDMNLNQEQAQKMRMLFNME